jgi:hypothetical protein
VLAALANGKGQQTGSANETQQPLRAFQNRAGRKSGWFLLLWTAFGC